VRSLYSKIFLILLILTVSISAQNSRVAGKIIGTVSDKATNEPLIGVNVIIEGTFFGASTDVDGFFTILNVPAGTYTVQFEYIGYKKLDLQEVTITPGATKKIDVSLSEEIIEGETVVVTAEKPVVDIKETASVTQVSSAEIKTYSVDNFADIVAQKVGAIETDNGTYGGIHIRGGRADEIAYLVDGVNTNDPFTGGSTFDVNNNSIEQLEIITGGFNAEYGEAMSGMVQIVTKSGSLREYDGEFEITSDAPFAGTDLDFGYSRYYGSFSGPIPLLEGRASFRIDGNFIVEDDRDPRYYYGKKPHNDLKRLSPSAKFNFEILPGTLRLETNLSYVKDDYQSYNHAWSLTPFTLNQYLTLEREDRRASLTMTHTLSTKTFYEVTASYYKTGTSYSGGSGQGINEWEHLTYRLDWVRWAERQGMYDRNNGTFSGITEEEAFHQYYRSIGYGRFEDDGSFSFFDRNKELEAMNSRYHTAYYYYLDENGDIARSNFDIDNYNTYLSDPRNPDYEGFGYWSRDVPGRQGSIDNQYLSYDPLGNFVISLSPRYHDRSTEYYQIEGALSTQVTKSHFIKAGGYFRAHELSYVDLQFYNPNPYYDFYSKKPIKAAAYLQDKIEYDDITINAGVRWDYFDTRSKAPVNVENLDEGFEDAKPKYQFSPRLGISFAVSNTGRFTAYYGQFMQQINLSDIYQNLTTDLTSGVPLVGNPNIQTQRTIAYEFGYDQEITKDVLLSLKAFYKDQSNLSSTEQVAATVEGSFIDYTIYETTDFSQIKGFEVKLKKSLSPGLSGEATYSFLDAKGTGSDSRDFYYLFRGTDTEVPKKEYPLAFDVTHDVKLRVNYFFMPNSMPEFLGIDFFGGMSANAFYTWQSGVPYTPEDSRGNLQELFSKRMPSTQRLDIRLDKQFELIENVNFRLFADIRNVFNTENVVNVYRFSGEPDNDGTPPRFQTTNYENHLEFGYASPESNVCGRLKAVEN
jgi:outer membrane receptor protein involved in Fe transport